ncbi:CBS domain-containing protein [Dyella sp. ASV21]|uniref:CBS domain-containing protein n=1 Tax=Dyella sp. ASV21 TaxID=2795114 RepID=UPI0018EC652A
MRAIDIATSRVVVVSPEQSLRAAALLLEQHMAGCLVVVRANEPNLLPIGIITDRDISRLAVAEAADAGSTRVGSVMSCPPVLCSHDATLTEIVDIMHGSGLRRLPVADPAGRLVGIVTADDALVALTQLLQQLTEVLVVEPSLKDRLVAMQSVREAGDSGSP